MKNVFRPCRFLAICLNLAMLTSLVACKEEETLRPANIRDIYGTWTAQGLVFESGGVGGETPPTKAQLAVFDNLKGSSYTFNNNGTYIKRSFDSTLSLNSVSARLEKGTFSLVGGQLTLTTTNPVNKKNYNQYYNCLFVKNTSGIISGDNLALQATKELLLKSLEEEKEDNPLYQQTRDFLLKRDLFRINQTLYE